MKNQIRYSLSKDCRHIFVNENGAMTRYPISGRVFIDLVNPLPSEATCQYVDIIAYMTNGAVIEGKVSGCFIEICPDHRDFLFDGRFNSTPLKT